MHHNKISDSYRSGFRCYQSPHSSKCGSLGWKPLIFSVWTQIKNHEHIKPNTTFGINVYKQESVDALNLCMAKRAVGEWLP
jgi:hypothetical protein